MTWRRVKTFAEANGLLCMVALALVVAGILVLIGMTLYETSGAAKLDLSRPGYEKVRETVMVDSEETEFQPTGRLDRAALEDFKSRYASQRDTMQKLGDFGGDVLSDAALNLAGETDDD
jgi:hypothetical protein